MAKKQSNQPTDMPEVIQIPINWNLEGAPLVFANQLLVNFDDHEVYLHFFEIVPPVILSWFSGNWNPGWWELAN